MKGKARRSHPTPRDAEASHHARRGAALEAAGRLRDAAAAYRRVTELQPRNVVALVKCGRLLRSIGELEESRRAFERAIKVDPRNVDALILLAEVYKNLRESERAIETYTRAAWTAPHDVRAPTGLAGVYERLNDLEKVEEQVAKALELDPRNVTARITLARVARRRGEPDRAAGILRELLGERVTDETRHRAGFELGRCLEEMGDHAGAFEAIREANEAQSRTPMTRAVQTKGWLELLDEIRTLTPDRLERWAESAPPDEGDPPVLLVGFPRSGTTMTEQILGAHPEIAVSDERNLFGPMLRALLPRDDRGGALIPQVDRATDTHILEARRAYRREAGKLLALERGATLLVDKNPMNIVNLGFFSRVFPDARVIVAQRDPRDVCLSCYFQEFVPNHNNVFFMSLEGTLEMYRRVMDIWIEQREMLRLPVLTWRYEEVTADFERAARGLIDFVGRGWDDRVLRFHEGARHRFVSTPSYEAVTAPVHTRAQGRWRRYEAQLAPILASLEPYVRALGYAEGSGEG